MTTAPFALRHAPLEPELGPLRRLPGMSREVMEYVVRIVFDFREIPSYLCAHLHPITFSVIEK